MNKEYLENITFAELVTVLAPPKILSVARAHLSHFEIHSHERFEALIKTCQCMDAIRIAIVYPVTSNIMEVVNNSVKAGLIIPILIGPLVKMKFAALEARIDIAK